MTLHPWVGFLIMPLFAFANTGVTISGTDIGHPVVAAIFVGLAYPPIMLDAAKIGILAASVASAPAGLLTLVVLTPKPPGPG